MQAAILLSQQHRFMYCILWTTVIWRCCRFLPERARTHTRNPFTVYTLPAFPFLPTVGPDQPSLLSRQDHTLTKFLSFFFTFRNPELKFYIISKSDFLSSHQCVSIVCCHDYLTGACVCLFSSTIDHVSGRKVMCPRNDCLKRRQSL